MIFKRIVSSPKMKGQVSFSVIKISTMSIQLALKSELKPLKCIGPARTKLRGERVPHDYQILRIPEFL